MICYCDRTFCPFHQDCSGAALCGRAFTDEVKADAIRWWGSDDAPVALYAVRPECFVQGACRG